MCAVFSPQWWFSSYSCIGLFLCLSEIAMPTTVDAVETILTRAKSLYSLPTVAARLLALTQVPQIDLRAIRETLEQDPALTAKILRVVNSSLFCLTRGVSDLAKPLLSWDQSIKDVSVGL